MIERAIEALNALYFREKPDGTKELACHLCENTAPEVWLTMNSDLQFAAGCHACGYSSDIYNPGLAKREYEKAAHETARHFPL